MKPKLVITSFVLAVTLLQSHAATSTNSAPTEGVAVETGGEKLETIKETPELRDALFGMFIHWGVYSVPGHDGWVQWNEQIPVEEYAQLAQQFNPRKFDAGRWAEVAKSGGMKYLVLTARHHDGFALFDELARRCATRCETSRAKWICCRQCCRACRTALDQDGGRQRNDAGHRDRSRPR